MASRNREIPPPGERFKKTLTNLAGIMSNEIQIARNKGVNTISPEIINFGITLIEATDGDVIAGGFITRSYSPTGNYWGKILEKDESFFMSKENSTLLFGELSSGIVDGFINLIKEKHVSENLMMSVWQHLHAMVKISIAFVHFERKPHKVKTEDGFSVKYTQNERPHIDLLGEAERWSVDLANVV